QAFRTGLSGVRVPAGSPLAGRPVGEAGLAIHAVRRAGAHLLHQRPGTTIAGGDTLLVETGRLHPEALLAGGARALPGGASPSGARQRVEAVIMPESTLVGSRVGTLELLSCRGITVVAVAARTPRIEGSLADLRLSIGDVLYLEGDRAAIDE